MTATTSQAIGVWSELYVFLKALSDGYASVPMGETSKKELIFVTGSARPLESKVQGH